MTDTKLDRHLLIGVILISMGTLALEVVLTRIFSVTMWYHFAFLAISMALMGSAIAGVTLYFVPRLTQPEQARRWISYATITLTLSIPLTFWLYLQIPFVPVLMNRTTGFTATQVGYLALIYLLLSVPFFLSGVVLALVLAGWSAVAGRIYWADLTGAALGCLVSIAALEWLGGVNALLLISVIIALAAVSFSQGWQFRQRRQWASLVVLLLVVILSVTNGRSEWLRIRVNKMGGEEPVTLYEKWNVHSRVTVYEPVGYPFFWAVSPEKWTETVETGGNFHHALLLIDAVAGTPVQSFNGDLQGVAFLRFDLTSLVYHLVARPETLVIGPGGGRDVLSALVSGAPHVTAVEVNPAVIEAVRGPLADFAGYLYERPDVTVAIADARGYIERSPQQYDVIQASLIDTWAAGGSGAFALSENSLYTQQAFESYYEHLSDRGILTISRWYLPDRPAETLRLVSTAIAGWQAAGVADPRPHIVVVAHQQATAQTEGLSTTLLKREPFTAAEISQLQTVVAELGYTVIYAPGLTPFEEVGQFIADPERQRVIDSYPLDISPATDNRPFFFNLVLLGDLFDPALSGSGVYRTSMEAIYILFTVIGVSVFLAMLFVLLPLGVGTWGRRGAQRLERPSATLLGYVGALGVAFMLVEIPTIQKLTVYLGRPVYSLAVVLFTLLLCSGLGSLWSSTWPATTVPRQMRRLFPALVLVLLAYLLVNTPLLQATLHLSLALRIVVAAGLLSLLGFLMGIPFPVAIRWAGTRQPGVIPWLWGMNGVMSVLGSASATALAIHVGFALTLLLAALAYALAGALLWRELR